MRFLGIGDSCDLGDMYQRLQAAGHEVRVCVRDVDAHDTCEGLVTRVDDWKAALPWVREAGTEGIILFETATDGPLQDELRGQGFQVIGGSARGDRLETDRPFGQQTMREVGMTTAATHEFDDFDSALEFVRATRRRYVYKPNGAGFASTRTYVGELEDGADMEAQLLLQRDNWKLPGKQSVVLMEYLAGVEVGVGAYFNGQRFLQPACLDWEHKRFFPGDLGELTGEMGTLVTYSDTHRLFDVTLARMEAWLRAAGYCGYINLNTIVNAAGIWPLEFTCRFGYPGYSILQTLQREDWALMFKRMVEGRELTFPTRPGFAIGVVLTVPPFPYRTGYADLSKGAPICFRPQLTDAQRDHLHPGEVAVRGGQWFTSGAVGYVMVATGTGETVEDAQRGAYEVAHQVVIPNVRYRRDIGDRFLLQDRAALKRLGLFG